MIDMAAVMLGSLERAVLDSGVPRFRAFPLQPGVFSFVPTQERCPVLQVDPPGGGCEDERGAILRTCPECVCPSHVWLGPHFYRHAVTGPQPDGTETPLGGIDVAVWVGQCIGCQAILWACVASPAAKEGR